MIFYENYHLFYYKNVKINTSRNGKYCNLYHHQSIFWTETRSFALRATPKHFDFMQVWRFAVNHSAVFSKSTSCQMHYHNWGESHLTLFLMGFLTNRTLWGADLPPPLVVWLLEDIFYILFLDVKGQNPKAQPSTLKIIALRRFWKILNFGENPKSLKICYLEIRIFIQKRPAKIKPIWI